MMLVLRFMAILFGYENSSLTQLAVKGYSKNKKLLNPSYFKNNIACSIFFSIGLTGKIKKTNGEKTVALTFHWQKKASITARLIISQPLNLSTPQPSLPSQ
jgi:hypothetical protein